MKAHLAAIEVLTVANESAKANTENMDREDVRAHSIEAATVFALLAIAESLDELATELHDLRTQTLTVQVDS